MGFVFFYLNNLVNLMLDAKIIKDLIISDRTYFNGDMCNIHLRLRNNTLGYIVTIIGDDSRKDGCLRFEWGIKADLKLSSIGMIIEKEGGDYG